MLSRRLTRSGDEEQGSLVALAITLALALGAVVLVIGLAVGPVLTALLCSVLAVCVVGLAVAMI